MISTAGDTALTVAYDISNEEWVRRFPDLSEKWFGDPASRMSSNAGIAAGGDGAVGDTTTDYRHSVGCCTTAPEMVTVVCATPLKTKIVDVARMKNRPTS